MSRSALIAPQPVASVEARGREHHVIKTMWFSTGSPAITWPFGGAPVSDPS